MSDALPDVVRDEVYDVPDGLEDFDPNDQTIPLIKLDHDTGMIVDGLSGQQFDRMELIAVGLVKQRVLWPAKMSEGDAAPLCKSYNFKIGNPDIQKFPWKASGFAFDAERTQLPCDDCKLKDWGTHPSREIPWCSEQHTYAVLQNLRDDVWAPALFTFQRSAIKPSNAYLTSFIRAKEPLYVCTTIITLDNRKRGNVDFVVPQFARGTATDREQWPFYASTYRNIREFVQTPRSSTDDEGTEESVEEAVGGSPVAPPPAATPPTNPATAAPAAAPAPAAQAAPAAPAPAGDDDLPF